jgi:dTDP-4-amino-4,6-dideoxygalactose transaminase
MDHDQLERCVTLRTKALIVTHIGGLPAAMDRIGRLWDAALDGCPWLIPQRAPAGAQSTYHLWVATFEGEKHGVSKEQFVNTLKKHGAPFEVGYTNRPAYRHPVFAEVFPAGTYPDGLCPNAEHMIPRMILGYTMIPWDRACRAADALREVIRELS